jgi:hypothetical protein
MMALQYLQGFGMPGDLWERWSFKPVNRIHQAGFNTLFTTFP